MAGAGRQCPANSWPDGSASALPTRSTHHAARTRPYCRAADRGVQDPTGRLSASRRERRSSGPGWSQKWSPEPAKGRDRRRTHPDTNTALTCGNVYSSEPTRAVVDRLRRSSNLTAERIRRRADASRGRFSALTAKLTAKRTTAGDAVRTATYVDTSAACVDSRGRSPTDDQDRVRKPLPDQDRAESLQLRSQRRWLRPVIVRRDRTG